MEMGVYSFFSVFSLVLKYIGYIFLLIHFFAVPIFGAGHMMIFVWPAFKSKWQYILIWLGKILYIILGTSLFFYGFEILDRGLSLVYIDKIYIVLSIIPYFTMGCLRFKYF